jgi:hypothetical protein
MEPFFNGNNKLWLFYLKLQISVEKALQFYSTVLFDIINVLLSPRSLNLTFVRPCFPIFLKKLLEK